MTRVGTLINKITPVWFVLYVISLATTLSGMEIFSTLLILSVFSGLLLAPPVDFRWKLPPFFPMIAFFAAVVAVGILMGTATPAERLYDLGRLRFFLTFAALYYYLIGFPKSHRQWLLPLAAVCTVIGIYGFFQHFFPLDLIRPEGKKILMFAIQPEQIGPLVLGTFNHHLTFASVYFFYAALFFAVGLFTRPRFYPILGLGLLLFLLCLWTQSRTAWIAVPMVITLVVLPLGRKRIFIAMATLLFLIAVSWSQDQGFQERVMRTFMEGDGYNLGQRTRLWEMQWGMFKSSPLVGVGWNNNERRCAQYFIDHFPGVQAFCGHAHSNFLQILSTTGILGLVSFFLIWLQVVFRAFREWRAAKLGSLNKSVAWGLFAGFVGFHIQGLTQWNFGDAEVLHNVMFFWAVTAAMEKPRNPA